MGKAPHVWVFTNSPATANGLAVWSGGGWAMETGLEKVPTWGMAYAITLGIKEAH